MTTLQKQMNRTQVLTTYKVFTISIIVIYVVVVIFLCKTKTVTDPFLTVLLKDHFLYLLIYICMV